MVVFVLTLALACLSGLVGGFTRDEWFAKTNLLESLYDYENFLDNERELVNLHSKDVIVMPPGFPAVSGKEEYRKSLHENRTDEYHHWMSSNDELLYFTDDMAIMKIDFEYNLKSESQIKTGKGIIFLGKMGGQAFLRLGIWNYDS